MKLKEVNIKEIKAGDTILHNEEIKTVSKSNIKYNQFIGVTLFGDSYNLGNKQVKKIIEL